MPAMKHRPEPVDGFRAGKSPEKIEALREELSEKKMNFLSQSWQGKLVAGNFGADLVRRAREDGLAGVAGHVRDTAAFEYELKAREEGLGVVEHGEKTVDLAAGMEVLGLMTGLIMLSVGLLVYSETQAAMPAPEDPELANASQGLNDTAVSVVNLSKVAFIIGAAAIMISYLVGGLGGMGGGGGLQ